jgi:hypothetical protein
LASTGGPGPPGGRVHGGSVSAGFEQPDDPGRKRAGRRPTAPTVGGPAAASGDDLARIRRIIAALLRKAAATSFPHEATARCAKAEALRDKYGL